MAKRKKGQDINGWLVLDKPLGMTSTQGVAFVRRVMNANKAGHGGTLDPLATGVLPIALGEATKTMPFILEADKKYEFTVTWGEERNTDDAEGEAVAQSESRPNEAQIAAILSQFEGEISQTPPAFSAIQIDGQRAYAKARKGEDVEMPSRQVTVHSLKLLATRENSADFEAHVSKGTYIRALGRDMGRVLGCYGYISRLHRTKAGPFEINQSIAKEKLDFCSENGHCAQQFLLDAGVVLDDISAYRADPAELMALKAGRTLQRIHLKPGMMKVIGDDGQLASLVEVDAEGTVRVLKNFNM